MPSSSIRIDEEASRAAARALYEGQMLPLELTTDEGITAWLHMAIDRPPGPPTKRTAGERFPHPVATLPAPRSSPSISHDVGRIETVLRSAPQICAHCRLLSDAPARPCPSPRGHYFVTDYTAMASKVRTMLG